MPLGTIYNQRVSDWLFGGAETTLNASITAGNTITTLTTVALTRALAANAVVLVGYNTTSVEAYTVSGAGAAIGATSVPVVSQTAAHSHSSGDRVVLNTTASAPSPLYMGLSTDLPFEIANTGSNVTYGSTTLTDTLGRFRGTNLLANATVIAGTSTGTITSNTINTITLTGSWTGGTPASGTLYVITMWNEPTSGSYARVSYANTVANWNPLVGTADNTKYNLGPITFPVSTGSWGNMQAWLIADAPTAGNLVAFGYADTSQLTSSGQTISISANQLSIFHE